MRSRMKGIRFLGIVCLVLALGTLGLMTFGVISYHLVDARLVHTAVVPLIYAAAMGGFDRPIIHGLCSYGIVLRTVTDDLLGGDAARVGGFTARFAVCPMATV